MADAVTVTVKLFATLKKYAPNGRAGGIPLTLPAGATVRDVVDRLDIPHDQAAMLVAGDTYVQVETVLEDGQEISIFPPLAGGTVLMRPNPATTPRVDAAPSGGDAS